MKSWRLAIAMPLIVLAFGVLVFVWQISTENPGRAWQAFLVNLLFFSGIAQTGPVLAAIYYLTEARWGLPIMRLSVGVGLFLPISLLLFAILFAGFPYLPMGSPDAPAREAWFYSPFFFARDFVALALLYSVSLVFAYRFLCAVSGVGPEGVDNERPRSSITRLQRGVPSKGNARSLTLLASLVLGLYVVVFSLIGFDLVMALDRHWYSTLFGGYFFMSSFYAGLSAIPVAALVTRKALGSGKILQKSQLWDLGKLLFAFGLLTGYFVWSQYLVIWYGNLPEEVGFFTLRIKDERWAWLTWTALVLIFPVPFLLLLGQRAKQSSPILITVGAIVLVGMWLERYLLVAPSLGITDGVVIGWTEGVATLTFIAAMTLSYSIYIRLVLPRASEIAAPG